MQTTARWLAIALVAAGSVRIYSTYKVFNHTVDEPAHIACGLEWLQNHRYELEPQHPPLARVMAALGPSILKCHLNGSGDMYRQGEAVLFENGRYNRNLFYARLGILPFFWLACTAVFAWSKRHFAPAVGVLAVAVFTMIPPVLGHAALATTDMAAAATLVAAFVAMVLWIESPVWWRAAVFGVCAALAILSKFSNLVFFPAVAVPAVAAMLATKAAHRPRVSQFAIATAMTAVIVWAGYFFSFGQERTNGWWVPAPELFIGVQQVREHNRIGHPSFLLGQLSMHGFWYYYPVVLALKTPIAISILALAGAVVCLRRAANMRYLLPVLFAAGILLVAAFSSINIGVRHVLAVYAAASVLAAIGALELWKRGRAARVFAAVALGATVMASAASHPDYLAYTNALAGPRPENVLADSDLDWGQDMKRLAKRVRERQITMLTFDPFVSFPLGVSTLNDNPDTPRPGYHAVSVTQLKVGRMGLWKSDPKRPLWPERYEPLERVGKGILLYYVPEPTRPRPVSLRGDRERPQSGYRR